MLQPGLTKAAVLVALALVAAVASARRARGGLGAFGRVHQDTLDAGDSLGGDAIVMARASGDTVQAREMASTAGFNRLQNEAQDQARQLDRELSQRGGIAPGSASELRARATSAQAADQSPAGAKDSHVDELISRTTRMREETMAQLRAEDAVALDQQQQEGGTAGDGTNMAAPGAAVPVAANSSGVPPVEEYANASNTEPLPAEEAQGGPNATSTEGDNTTFPAPYTPSGALYAGAPLPRPLPVVMHPGMGMLHPPTVYGPAAMPMHPFAAPHMVAGMPPHPFMAPMPPPVPVAAAAAAGGFGSRPAQQPALEGFSGPWIGVLGAPTTPQCAEAAERARKQEGGGSLFSSGPSLPTSCFNNYYADWLTAAGARVFGVPFDASDELLDVLVPAASAFVWPGGDIIVEPNTTLYQTARRILDRVITENRAGRLLPLLTICQGHELLASLVHGSTSILTTDTFDADGVGLPVVFTPEASQSHFLATLGSQATQLLASLPLATHLNADGVTPQAFASSRNLAVLFRLVAATADLAGRPMVSMMEARTMPIVSFQWHPERPQFDWRKKVGAPHSAEATTAMAAIADAFVSIARLAPRAVTTKDAARAMEQLSVFSMRRQLIGNEPAAGIASLLFDPPTPPGIEDRSSPSHRWRLNAGNLTEHRSDVRPSMENREPAGDGVNATTGQPLQATNSTAAEAELQELEAEAAAEEQAEEEAQAQAEQAGAEQEPAGAEGEEEEAEAGAPQALLELGGAAHLMRDN